MDESIFVLDFRKPELCSHPILLLFVCEREVNTRIKFVKKLSLLLYCFACRAKCISALVKSLRNPKAGVIVFSVFA